jgi:uridine kinase
MQLTDNLLDLCKGVVQPIITIDGPAGAGKTTFAQHLKHLLSKNFSVSIIHMDDLYNGWETPFDSRFSDALMTIVKAHRNATDIPMATYNWATSQYGEMESKKSSELLILEGVASYSNAVSEYVTAGIWLDISPESGLQRVLARDGSAHAAEMYRWLEIQQQHFEIEDTQKAADFVITT